MPAVRGSHPGWRLDPILAQAREPVFVLSPERRILVVNRAWEDLTGHAESECVGLECRPHGPTRAGDLPGLGGSFCPPPEAMAGAPAGGPTMIVRKGGERIQRRVEFWPFHGPDGNLVALLGVVRLPDAPTTMADAESQSLRYTLLDFRARMFARHAHDALIGSGAEHQAILDGIDAAMGTTVPVTILGEPGTGKRFVARLIHQRSPRRQMPLLGYDCRAIPAEVLERELFGGPTPPDSPEGPAALVAPAGSTLVLGDVLALPRDLQGRLAAALRDTPRPVRVIATTAGNLDEARATEQIRADLYHALNVLVLRLQSLRDRLDELPLLTQALLERANLRGQATRSGFKSAAIEALIAHDWPGNLRELAQVVDEAHLRARGELIDADDLPAQILGHRGGAYIPTTRPTPLLPLKDRLLAYERQLIEEALGQSRGNKTRAARRLGVNRPFLYRRIRELGIADPEAESPGAPEGPPVPVDGGES